MVTYLGVVSYISSIALYKDSYQGWRKDMSDIGQGNDIRMSFRTEESNKERTLFSMKNTVLDSDHSSH